MPLTDQIKNYAKKMVENRPDPSALRTLVRSRKPQAIRFRDDGIVPNNPRFPVLVYRRAVALNAKAFDPGTLIDALFETHGWARSWRDTVYDFVHYHSQIHEVMGCRARQRQNRMRWDQRPGVVAQSGRRASPARRDWSQANRRQPRFSCRRRVSGKRRHLR